MPATIQYPDQSTAPADIVAHVKARIMSGASLTSMQVRLVVDPNPTEAPYVAERHVAVRVAPPAPMPKSGAGRFGYKVTRLVQLFVYTESLLDQAGSDEEGLKAHLNFEDLLIDIMVDERPESLQISGEKQGIRGFRYIGEGNVEPKRFNPKSDRALLLSVLNFEIEYLLRTRVSKDTFT